MNDMETLKLKNTQENWHDLLAYLRRKNSMEIVAQESPFRNRPRPGIPGDWVWETDKASYNFYMRAYRILLRNGHKETDGVVVQVKEKIDDLIDFWRH